MRKVRAKSFSSGNYSNRMSFFTKATCTFCDYYHKVISIWLGIQVLFLYEKKQTKAIEEFNVKFMNLCLPGSSNTSYKGVCWLKKTVSTQVRQKMFVVWWAMITIIHQRLPTLLTNALIHYVINVFHSWYSESGKDMDDWVICIM